ncbi:hypothetical protein M405DRAFT_830065, partial [Rhizopogon salebrosus TDB-379]
MPSDALNKGKQYNHEYRDFIVTSNYSCSLGQSFGAAGSSQLGRKRDNITSQCTITILFSLEVEVSCLVPNFISLDRFLPPGLALWTVATLVESRATLMMQYALATAWNNVLKMTL